MSKKQTIKELRAENAVLKEVNEANAKFTDELIAVNEELAQNLAEAMALLSEPQPDEVDSYGTPEDPIILNDHINSLIAQTVMRMDEDGEQLDLHGLAILNSIKI